MHGSDHAATLSGAVTVPSTVSIVVAVVGALFALVTARISTGPGWRELAPFSASAALAAIFAACDSVYTLPVAPSTVIGASRLALFVAGLHCAAWFFYGAAQEGRLLTRFERSMVGGVVVVGMLALVPHLFVSERVYARPVAWLHVAYHDTVPTRLEELCYAYYAFALVLLIARYVVKWRRRERGALAHLLGLSALLAAGVNDALASARVYDGPYLLDLGFLAVVACVGTSLTSRFLESARSLEEQTAQLRATQVELVKRERLAALGELSAVVAHEVRTPVSIMFNALSVLRRQPTTSETQALITIVEEEAQRLKRMIDDLLAFARPQTLHVAPVDLRALLDGAVEAARSSTESPCDVVIDVAEGVSTVACDEHLLRAAVVNLVTNAFQASRRLEPIRLSASREAGRVRIAVSDDGVGIPRELYPRLFTPFFTTRPTGTGLGLAVVRRIAEAHGGEAYASRAPGPGATFVIAIPVEPRAQPSADTSTTSARAVS